MDGPMMFLGGSTVLKDAGPKTRVGDLSGLVLRRLPPGIRGRYSPGPGIGAIADWERRIDAVADLAATQDIRLISGMPSWLVILFERVARPALRALTLGGPRGVLEGSRCGFWRGRLLALPAC